MFVRDGESCVAYLEPTEATVLRDVMAEVLTLLTDGFDRDDPVIERLFPDVYRDDPEAAADLRRYVEDDLKTGRQERVGDLLAELPQEGGEIRLDDEQADTWLRMLTDARLALGVRLRIEDDTDLVEEIDEAVMRDPTSPRVAQLSVYEFLTVLQVSLLEALVGY